MLKNSCRHCVVYCIIVDGTYSMREFLGIRGSLVSGAHLMLINPRPLIRHSVEKFLWALWGLVHHNRRYLFYEGVSWHQGVSGLRSPLMLINPRPLIRHSVEKFLWALCLDWSIFVHSGSRSGSKESCDSFFIQFYFLYFHYFVYLCTYLFSLVEIARICLCYCILFSFS